MEELDSTIEEFDSAVGHCRCVQIFLGNHWPNDSKRKEKLKELGKVRKMTINNSEDIIELKSVILPKYKDKSNSIVGWHTPGAISLKLEEATDIFLRESDNSYWQLIDKMRKGLIKDIIITSIYDQSINERFVLDGVHRLITLNYFYNQETNVLKNLISSSFEISMIEYVSPVAGLFVPLDFINLYYEK